jgi:hypothetical protein
MPGNPPGVNHKKDKLTMKQKMFVKEYIKSGNGSAAVRSVYNTKHGAEIAYKLTHQPKIQSAIQDALLAANLDEGYASGVLKEIIAAGNANKEAARPADALAGLKMFFELKGYLGKQGQAEDEEQKAKLMSNEELVRELEALNKNQERMIRLYKEGAQEAEISDDSEGVDNQVQPEHK